MNSDTPKYYQPYDSGDDTDDGTNTDSEDYDSDDLPDFEDPRIRREEDPRYALIRTAGPNFNTSEQQLKYMEHAPGASYDTSTNITSLSSLVYLNPPKTTKTSLFSVKSINRDTKVYPSPFNFTLKTPRVYKNVTKVQLVQLSFPNNVAGYATNPLFEVQLINELVNEGINISCLSSCVTLAGCTNGGHALGFIENRVTDGRVVSFAATVPSGIHTKEDIARLLNNNLNNTPPLNCISFEEFKQEFQLHHDISILFNEPGDKFYSNVTKRGYGPHSKSDIMHTYFPQLHLDSFPVVTDTIAFNAYYLPVLKELFVMREGHLFIKTTPYSYDQAYDLVMNKFLGLDSNIYYNILQNNLPVLQSFRRKLTFEFNPINNYTWSYDSDNKQFSVSHNCLHPSLQRDISNKYNSLFTHELSLRNLTSKSFQTLRTNFANNKSIYSDLIENVSTKMSGYLLGGNYSYNGGINHNTDLGTYSAISLNDGNIYPGFSSMFQYSSIIGRQFHSNFHGTFLNFNNFLDYHSTMSSYYNNIMTASTTISSVYGNINYYHHTYVSTKYCNVLPYSLISTKTYNHCNGVPVNFFRDKNAYASGAPVTDPLILGQVLRDAAPGTTLTEDPCTVECCRVLEILAKRYYGCLPVNSIVEDNPASIGYLLGVSPLNFSNFSSLTTTFSLFSSTNADNFNFLLQLNTELSMNNMDIAMNENYAISNETTGQVNLMAAKILMQGVGTGEVSETAIQNPIVYDPPLGKLDRLSFKLYIDDPALTPMWLFFPYDIGINEWDATFQIDEEVALAGRDNGWSGNIPSVPIPNNPSAFQYLALTSTNNPNNKSFP
jgi:hypothetical protein